jgi:hypothetical protein
VIEPPQARESALRVARGVRVPRQAQSSRSTGPGITTPLSTTCPWPQHRWIAASPLNAPVNLNINPRSFSPPPSHESHHPIRFYSRRVNASSRANTREKAEARSTLFYFFSSYPRLSQPQRSADTLAGARPSCQGLDALAGTPLSFTTSPSVRHPPFHSAPSESVLVDGIRLRNVVSARRLVDCTRRTKPPSQCSPPGLACPYSRPLGNAPRVWPGTPQPPTQRHSSDGEIQRHTASSDRKQSSSGVRYPARDTGHRKKHPQHPL